MREITGVYEKGFTVGQRVIFAATFWLVGSPLMKDRTYWLRQGEKIARVPADDVRSIINDD